MKNSTSDLEKYFKRNTGRLIYKWDHYFDVYERHFKRFRNKEVTILEIGVSQGGSLQMWKDYFGDKAKIFGIDIDPRCKDLEEENIKIFIGSQSDRKFLRKLKSQIPKVDILIDDGGHMMRQQVISYEELFDHVQEEGVYLCEDVHTSYWLKFGGGHRRRGTFIEYTKHFIDYIHAFHSQQKSLQLSSFTTSVNSLHYYDSIVVIEKRKREKPFAEKTGTPSFIESPRHLTFSQKVKEGVFIHTVRAINMVLRFLRLPGFIWK